MRPPFVTQIVLALCIGISPESRASSPDEDHLVPLKEVLGSSAAYQELWQRKLLLTPGETARFVSLPGTVGVETAISVYQAPGKENALPGAYWVTVTQASERLWNSVAPGAENRTDPQTIGVERCDAPIAEATALALHKVWVTMLSQARPQKRSNEIIVDSSREIFSATNSSEIVLQGESSTAPKQNTKALVSIAASLMDYCEAPVAKRAELMRNIEKATSKLLARVVPASIRKKESASSQKGVRIGVR
jgi:hypothetical protein